MKLDAEKLRESFAQLSIKEFVASGLELYLSMSLAISFFECPDESRRDEQELQTLYTMSWSPALLGAFIVYGHRVSKRLGPAPENFERNLRRAKIFTWIYSLLFLVWDEDMTHKRGPALHVAIIFCVCDLVRFELEISGLMDDDHDDDDELARLAAAVGALNGGDHVAKQQQEHAGANSSMSLNSMDSHSLYFDPQKPQTKQQLTRQSTESLTQDFVEMTTPAPSAVGIGMTASKKPTTLETLKAPAPNAAEISTGHSLNGEEPLARANRLSKRSQPVVFEF